MKLYKNLTPSVSIILPTYNRERLLKRAIDSVVNQTASGWELIAVDDGSDDNTFHLVNSYINHHENIRYMKHGNRKLPISLNVGLSAACGKYVTFLGSDDEYKPGHIQLRLEYMEENPVVDLIHGGVEVVGDPYVKDKHDLTKKVHLSECKVGGTFFGKREVFLSLGGFSDIEYSEDSDFFERAEKEYDIAKVDYPTYIYYRDTPGSITNTIR